MGNVSEEDYRYLCDIILNVCKENRNKFQDLKYKYKDNIKSNRRFERINNIAELIKVLEKRDDLSPENVSILYEIASFYNQTHLLNALHDRTTISSPTATEMPVQASNHLVQNKILSTQPTPTVKGKVYSLILDELGKSWIDFARALKVRESKIDQLKLTYSNQRRSCVAEILDYHEQNAHPRVWRTELLEALTKARRNDLRKSVQNIYDTYS